MLIFGNFITMNPTLSDWFDVIKNCSVTNTYKMGWCKSIVECCIENDSKELISELENEITLDEIL